MNPPVESPYEASLSNAGDVFYTSDTAPIAVGVPFVEMRTE